MSVYYNDKTVFLALGSVDLPPWVIKAIIDYGEQDAAEDGPKAAASFARLLSSIKDWHRDEMSSLADYLTTADEIRIYRERKSLPSSDWKYVRLSRREGP